MGIRLHHVSLRVADTVRALQFYRDVLGFPVIARPDLGFPGAWFGLGAHQLHLLELPDSEPPMGRPAHGGRDRHVAFTIDDLSDLVTRLERAEVPYTRSRSGRPALFCRDPDGNALEFIAP